MLIRRLATDILALRLAALGRRAALGAALGAALAPAIAGAQVAAPVGAPLAGPVGSVSVAAPSARVDSIFARFAIGGSPGCAVGVARDGRTVLERGYGMANLEYDVPNGPRTVFEAGSVSKQFTATAVVLLAQRGKLSLDDDARKYLPELPAYDRVITVRHLLNHTSGLRDWGSVVDLIGWPRGSRVHTHAHVLDIVSRQRSLNYPVGDEYSYTNTGYNLAAVLVSRVSGMSFAEFSRREIFEPAGMTATQWRDEHDRVVKGRATGYRQARDDGRTVFRQDMPFENVHGNGGLLTTVGDLLTWNEHLTNRTVPGGAATVAALERQAVLTNGRTIAYALGLFVQRYNGVPEIAHSGSTAGYRAYLARYPEQKLSVALLCNAGSANPTALARRVADVYLGDAARPPAPKYASGVVLPAETLARRAGLYRSTRDGAPLRLQAAPGGLVARGDTLRALSATRFANAPGTRTAELELDASGAVRAIRQATDDGDTVVYVPAATAKLGAAALAEYAGTYRSDEAEGPYTIAVKDGALVLRLRPAFELALSPAYLDAFTAAGGELLRFRRDRAGRVTEVSVGNGRVREMRFARDRANR